MSAVVIDSRTLEGTPVFRGTSVPVQALFEEIESGGTLEVFLRQNPEVSRELAIEALEEARESLVDSARVAAENVSQKTRFGLESKWLREHKDRYRGKWVALDGYNLVAHGSDSKAVYLAAIDAGVKSPLMEYIEETDPLPFAGW